MPEPRAKTRDEVREEFIESVHSMIGYWQGVEDATCDERVSGVAFSMLVLLDGCNMNFPAIEMVLSPHPDDPEYLASQGEDWYPIGLEFGGALHEMFHEHGRNRARNI